MKRLKRLKTWIVKDNICRKNYYNKEINKLILKSLLSNNQNHNQNISRIY